MDMNQKRRALARHRFDPRSLRRVETPEAFNEYIDKCCEEFQAMKLDTKKPRKSKPKQAELGMDREHVGGQVRDEDEAS